jgi:phage protein D
MNVPQVQYEIIYNGKDITADIKPHVKKFTYTDKAQGEADEIEIVLEDVDGLWKNEWYPLKGDTVSAKIIDVNGTLDCGVFTVDELTSEGSEDGDTFTIKGVAAHVTKPLRTRNNFAHENKTLREIANTIAAKHGLKLTGTIEEIRLERLTQYNETDLSFLKRLAWEFGYTFSVRADQLIFTSVYEIEDREAALEINRNEIISFSIADKTNTTFKSATVKHHSPKRKKLFTYTYNETRPAFNGVRSDSLQLTVKAENQQQAMLKARAALYNANSLQQEGTVSMPGNIYAIAGNAAEFVGAGRCSGRYYIHGSTHTVDPDGGYTTDIEIKRIDLVLKSREKG